MTVATLPLSDFVQVTVQVQPNAVQPPQFNQALIIGNSTVIPNSIRTVLFQGGNTILSQMVAYGFSLTSLEYLAATQYVANGGYFLWIGLQDTTAVATIAIGVAGTGYAVGDVVSLVHSGSSVLATATVTGISGGGATGPVTGLSLTSQGTGYVVASDLTTTGGTGTGLEINVLTLGETPLQAVNACRLSSPSWYLFTSTTAADSDNIAMAEWAQTATPVCQLFFHTSSSNALAGAIGSIGQILSAANYSRWQGCYATTQGVSILTTTTINSPNVVLASATGVVVGMTMVGAGIPFGTTLISLTGTNGVMSANATASESDESVSYQLAPNNAHIASALMGLAMGLNTGLANSYFILPFKTLVGMTVEPLSQQQVNNITSQNLSTYSSYAGTYSSYGPASTGNGQYFDQILGLDMLASDLQYGEANTLFAYKVIPQDDPGQAILLHAANVACGLSVTRGFLATAQWNGPTVLNLQAGNPVASGFLCQSPLYNTQSASARDARQSMPIYVAVTLAGAVQSILMAVYVQL